MTQKHINTLLGRIDGYRAAYADHTGGMESHYRLLTKIRKVRDEIAELTRPQTVIDFDGSFEDRLVAAGVPFTVAILPVPSTDRRELALWVAAVTTGRVN